jgi:hypothetical protein
MGNNASRVRADPRAMAVGALLSGPKGNKRKIHLFVGQPRDSNPEDVVAMDFACIATEATDVPLPSSFIPLCCFSDLCTPFFPFRVATTDGVILPVSLPLLALGRYEFGRAAVLGSAELLTKCSPESEADTVFLENFLRWVGGPSPVTRTMLLYDLQPDLSERLLVLLDGLGFGLEVLRASEGIVDFERYIAIFVCSDCLLISEIREFLSVGGAVVCFPAAADCAGRFAMNDVLADAGVGFVTADFFLVRPEADRIKIPAVYTPGEGECLLVNQIELFAGILRNSPVEMSILSPWATLLGAVVSIMRVGQCSRLASLAEAILIYLNRTRFQSPEGHVGLSPVHEVLVKLQCDVFQKLSAQALAGFEVATPFVGQATQFSDSEILTMRATHQGWSSTGLWLTPGTLCSLSMSREAPMTVIAQIGAHTLDLRTGNGPWERWPSLSITRVVTGRQGSIASPFGGLVYLMVHPPNSRSFEIEFSEACRIPFHKHGDIEVWQATHNCQVPWAELQTPNLILTIPTVICSTIPSVPDAVSLVAELFETIVGFLGAPAIPHRVVVDVNLPVPGVELGYPIFMEKAWLETALEATGPSVRLLQFLAFIAINSVPEQYFFPAFRGVLALLAATAALEKKWPGAQRIQQPHLSEFTPWRELSDILASAGSEPFAGALQKIFARGLMTTATRKQIAEAFVFGVTQRTKIQFPGLLDRVLATENCPWSPMEVVHGPS